MRILKIKGKDETTVTNQVKKEYGENVIIISKYQEKAEGFFGFLKKTQYVMTVAVEESSEKQKSEIESQVSGNGTKESHENSYDLLLGLKEQMEGIKKDIDAVKVVAKSNNSVETVDEDPKKPHLKTIVRNYLQEEGVHLEVIQAILDPIEDTEDVERLVRALYENIVATVKQSKEDNTTAQVIFFIGSTGVGKTTTIAKLTADYVLNRNKQVTLFTADTYRIAAIEQLKTYADIVGVPIEIIYSEEDVLKGLKKWHASEHIFIDTAGRSHKNSEQIEDMKGLLNTVQDKKVFLVLNMNTSYKDIKNIIDTYRSIVSEFQIIVTKLDETDDRGNLLNIAYYARAPIAYITNGQNVPDDFSNFDIDAYIKELLGRIRYE
ncbi:MAG: flagellar biosynthesis protein FlhF [Cellulosilyticaceae bacterium]